MKIFNTYLLAFPWYHVVVATVSSSVDLWKSNDEMFSLSSRLFDDKIELSLVWNNFEPGNWIGLGISKSGGMTDADITIATGTSEPKRYWSAGKKSPTLVGPHQEASSYQQETKLTLTFNHTLTMEGNEANDASFQVPIDVSGNKRTKFIYAIGPMSKGDDSSPRYHSKKGAFSLLFQKPVKESGPDPNNSGETQDDRVEEQKDAAIVIIDDQIDDDDLLSEGYDTLSEILIKSHGILMIISWCGVVPFAIFLARFGKEIFPNWYKYHRNCQLIAGAMTLVSFASILYNQGGSIAWDEIHHVLGVVLIGLLVMEITLGFVSNALWKPGKRPHILHDKSHWWLGRTVTIGFIINAMLGGYLYLNTRHILLLIQIIWLAMLSVTFVILNMVIGQKHEYLTGIPKSLVNDFDLGVFTNNHTIDGNNTNGNTTTLSGIRKNTSSRRGSSDSRRDGKIAAIVFFTVSGLLLVSMVCVISISKPSYEL